MKNKIFATLIVLLPLFAQNSAYAQGYSVLRTFHIGGNGGWDYIAVNPDLKRIYVAHSTCVNVIDENTGDTLGRILGTTGAHGIAFDNNLGKGFITCGQLNSVAVFDLKTNKVITQIKTAKGPDGILFDEFSQKIFVFDGKGKEVTVIDPSVNKVVDSIVLDGKPEAGVSDGAGNIYLNIEDKNKVIEIDATTCKIKEHWTTGAGESPSGLAIDRDNKVLFIGCDNELMVIMNAESGTVLAELPIGSGCDGTDFDPVKYNAFSSNGDGSLTIIHENSPTDFRVTAINVSTAKGARTSTIDPLTHHLFLPTAQFGETPKADSEHPNPRPKIIDGTFEILEVGVK